jgi:PAS domain S-box-containing protein
MRPLLNARLLADGWGPLAWSSAVFLGGLLITGYVLNLTQIRLHESAERQFMGLYEGVATELRDQLRQPLYGIKGAIGAQSSAQASGSLRRGSFRAYVGTWDIAAEFSGVTGFGYVERVNHLDLARFEGAARADEAPDFAVHGSSKQPELYIVKYMQPTAGNAGLLGLDLGSEPPLREAVDRAIESGEPSLSGSAADSSGAMRLFYMAPVYADGISPDTPQARRAALTGLFFAPLLPDRMLQNSAKAAQGLLELALFDDVNPSTQKLLATSPHATGASGATTQTVQASDANPHQHAGELAFAGRVLQLRAKSTPAFDAQNDRSKLPIRAVAGVSLNLLFAIIVWLLLVGKARANRLAIAMTRDLDRMAKVAMHTNNSVFITDKNFEIIWVNNAFTRLTGHPLSAAVGHTPGQLLNTPDTLKETVDHLNQMLMQGQSVQAEMQNVSSDGKPIWIVGDMQPLKDQAGNFDGYLSIETDITATKLAQKALANERQHLSNIIMGTRAGTWEWNVQTNALAINDRWAEMLGYVLQDLAPVTLQTWEDFCHPDDLGRARLMLDEHLGGSLAYYDIEIRMRHRDGHWVWIRDCGKTTIWTSDGKPEWVSGTHMDITSQKDADAQLAEQLKFVEVLLETTPTAMYIKDPAGRYVRFNKAFEELFGIDRAQWIGKTVFDLVPGEAAALMHEKDLVLFNSGGVQTYEAPFTDHRTGQLHDGLYRKAALTNNTGEVSGLIGTISDVTERNRVSQSLQEAKAVAEAATVAKSQFLANMSHEIRTPMNAILGMLGLLHRTDLTQRQLDYADKAESAAKSLLGLLNDILDFSKIDAGKMELDLQPFSVDRILRDLSVILSSSIGKKPVEVLFDIDPAIPQTLIGDSLRLQQVLINLGGNAIKFTAQGEVVIQIKVLEPSGPHTLLSISVRDSGIGIAPQNQAHIFGGFSQAEASTTRSYGGTGLGLSICKRLVALMGGDLRLESVLGQGSTFHFTLPLMAADQTSAEPLLPININRLAGPLNVLVVDDNPTARSILRGMAQSWGWQVDVADNGAQAVAWVSARAQTGQAPYQAIFMDWDMPGMDGWETIEQLQQINPLAAAPITVMVTAHGREMLAQRNVREQARLNAFLVKPITASMLLDAVVAADAGHSHPRAGHRVKAIQSVRLKGMRILVVEDNFINQQVAQEMLGNEGALVVLADNGQLGVAAVASAQPAFDVVLMDLQMPVMDGYTATRAIRQDLGLTKLPIIAMTANAMASDRAACLAAGMNDHVGKPFDLTHLVEVLRSHVLGVAVPSSNATPNASQAADQLPDSLPKADAVEADAALERLGNNAELYGQILLSYLQELASSPDQLDGFLEAGDLVEAGRLLHTLKGLSATVGASYMAAVAKATEAQVKGAGPAFALDDARAQFRVAVAITSEVMGKIAKTFGAFEQAAIPQDGPHALPANHVEVAMDAPSRTALVADIQKLQGLLTNSDMAAIRVQVQLRQTYPGAAQDLLALDAAMAAFDFPQAVIQCDALIRKFGSSF